MNLIYLNDTSIEEHYGCDRVKVVLDKIFDDLGVTKTYRFVTGESSDRIIKEVSSKDCKVAIINGEGTFNYKNSYRFELYKVIKYLKTKGAKVFLLNASIYLDNSEINRIFNCFEKIYVRSESDKNRLENLNIDSFVVPDLSFYYQSCSDDRRHAPKIPEKVFTDSVRLEDSLRNLSLCRESGSFWFSYLKTPSGPLGPLRLFRRLTRGQLKISNFLSCVIMAYCSFINYKKISDFDGFIANVEYIRTGRFHCACMAIRNNIRFDFIPSNTAKIEDMLTDARLIELYRREGSAYVLNDKSELFFDRCNEYKAGANVSFGIMLSNLRDAVLEV